MTDAHFSLIRNTSLPHAFRRIRLELARDRDYPEGSAAIAYTMIAPLRNDDRLDPAVWKSFREACRVVRHRPGEDDAFGHLVLANGRAWRIHYEGDAHLADESGIHFRSDRFGVGDYVSIHDATGERTYRITASQAL